MNLSKRIFALLLTALMLFALAVPVLTGCDGDKPNPPDNGEGGENTDPGNGSGGNEGGGNGTPGGNEGGNTEGGNKKSTYTVRIKTVGGMPLEGISVYCYKDETLEDMDGYATTDKDGIATFELPTLSTYRVVPDKRKLDGYSLDTSYGFTGTSADIILTSGVIKDGKHPSYSLGSVMHDFTVIDTEGNPFTLSEALKEKDAVLINFWFSTCSPCINEFPYMVSAYEKYKDDIAVVALNHDSRDNEESIKLFKSSMGLTFPVARDYTTLKTAFGVDNYPTSIMIDRYGVVCLIEVGGITSERPFTAMFDHFTGSDYKQMLIPDPSVLTPKETPSGVEMPSSEEISEAINKTGTTVTFAPEKNDEYSWPFIFGTKDGETCLMPSNKEKEDSYSILYATLELKAGQALAFDYFSSTERYNDFMVVLIDRRDIYQISGITDGWFTCYPFVALEDGEYELALCYYKDEDTNEGEDTVYIKNLRVTDTKSIDVETFIPRYAATDEKEDGSGFNSYVEVFYNEKDGYYHVGSVDGPLLLAQLMNSTPFSKTDIFTMAYNGEISLDGTIYYDQLLPYFSMASNSEITGYCPVTAELKELLEIVTQAVGLELDNPDQWLQICSYYSAYGTGGSQLADPTRGLSPESAIPSVETTPDTEEWPNSVTYNRVIMPRGLWYAFTPSRSGAYRITSNSDQEVEGWIFLADKTEYCIYGAEERNWKDETNLTMVTYFEAGTTYYIDIAYTDVYAVGTFTFKIEFIAPTTEIFFLASPGYFTFYENEGGDADTNEIVSGGIDIVFNEDTGYYHELRSDGSIGSILYVDFKNRTNIFDKSLEVMIGLDAFNFSKTEDDQYILNYINKYGKDNVVEKLKELWGDTYDEYADIYNLEDVLAGIYHGNGEDLTDEISAYLDKIVTDESVDHNGCIPVDKELAVLLQALMDKYTFDGVDYSWAKLCYYYKLIAPETAGE